MKAQVLLSIALLGVASGLAPAPTLAAVGSCSSARIREPFALPEGSFHAPGNLRICPGAQISPITRN